MSNRNDLLQQLIADPKSTDAERTAAQTELSENQREHVTQQTQDHELESFLASRDTPHQTFETRDLRKSLSTSSQRLLEDLAVSTLLVEADGAEDRLRSLVVRTGSDIVKKHVLAALTTLKWLQDVKGINHV